jgi:iron complex outermembrane receptor protein
MTKLFISIGTIVLLSGAIFAQGGTVKGRITQGVSNPIHDASVQITAIKASVVTDDDGKYVLTGVPAGKYTVRAHMEGFSDQTRVIEVAAGETIQADFDLEVGGLRAEVTVTAGGVEQTLFEAFQTVTALGSGQVLGRQTASLGEVLDGEAGVAKRSFGVGSSRPVVRGFDGDRVLVLQDGVRTGSLGSGSGDHGETSDVPSAERIEVVKGPGTLLYGSNALGGVVNVVSDDEKESHKGFKGFLTTGTASVDRSGLVSGGGDYGSGKIAVRGGFTIQRTGDYSTPVGKILNSSSRNNAGNIGGGYYGQKVYGTGLLSTSVRRYGIPFGGYFEGEDVDIDIRQQNRGLRYSGGFRNLKNSAIDSVQFSLDYVSYEHKEIEIDGAVESIGSVFDNKTFSYRSLFEQRKRGAMTGRFGFEGFDRTFQVNGAEQLITGKVRHNSFSAFTLQEYSKDRMKFQFGARVESNRLNPTTVAYRDRNFTGVSFGAGVNFSTWKGGAFIFNYTNSYRAPALEELYNQGPHIGTLTYEIGNQTLKNERANGLDVSVRHQSDRFRLTGDIYLYRINDFIYFSYVDDNADGRIDIEDGLPVAKYAQSDAQYLGAEFTSEAIINDKVTAIFGGDFVHANLTNNENLPRITPARLKTGLDLRAGSLTLRPEVSFTAPQERIAPLETRTAGYGLAGVSGMYTIGRDHTSHIFTLGVNNLTDRIYRNHLSFIKNLAPEPGRGIRFGYTVRFF